MKGVGDGLKGFGKTAAKTGAKVGGAIFGASAGLSLGGADKAVGLGMAGYAAGGMGSDAITNVLEMSKLRDNEEVFAGDVLKYADTLPADVDRFENISDLWNDYQNGELKLGDCTDEEKELINSCKELKEVYDYKNYENSGDAVLATIAKSLDGTIPPQKRKPSK